MTDQTCDKGTYLSYAREEDGIWRLLIECNGFPDCGFSLTLDESPEAVAFGITAGQMGIHHAAHQAHASRTETQA